MARLVGILPLIGRIGEITFYKTRDGYMARKRTGVSRERVKTDAAFQRTRENSADFARAASGARLFRDAIRDILVHISDSKMANRLTGAMVKVIRGDAAHKPGLRQVADGDHSLIRGFEFNQNCPLEHVLGARYRTAVNRATGNVTINIDPLMPATAIVYPSPATHFRFAGVAVGVDFAGRTTETAISHSSLLAIDSQEHPGVSLDLQVTPLSTKSLFILFGVEFHWSDRGVIYPLNDSAFNTLSVIEVDR